MAEFIALAAHELRTPVTTIYGFVRTLRHLSERLSEAQREELGQALEQQTERMTLLVEQLLDLSRLDAHAVEITPEEIPVREQVERVVAAVVPDRRDDVHVEVDESITAHVDRDALDRILSNLVTNAFKYGQAPVTVRAGESDRHFRLVVRGLGRRRLRRLRPEPVRALRAQRGLARPRHRHRPRARDRALLRPRAPRRPHLLRRGGARRGVRARAPARRPAAGTGGERAARGGGVGMTDSGGFGVVQLALLGEAVDALDGVAVFVWNEERRYVAVNDEACELVGRSREQILGMEVGEMSPDRATPLVEHTRHAPIALGSSVIHRPDGDVEIEWVTAHSVVANLPYMVSFCWRKGAAGRFPRDA